MSELTEQLKQTLINFYYRTNILKQFDNTKNTVNYEDILVNMIKIGIDIEDNI